MSFSDLQKSERIPDRSRDPVSTSSKHGLLRDLRLGLKLGIGLGM